MPEARLQRTRETLPDGYQFKDAAKRCHGEMHAMGLPGRCDCGAYESVREGPRTFAIHRTPLVWPANWNVIEGERSVFVTHRDLGDETAA